MPLTEILIPDPFTDSHVSPSTLMDFRMARDLRVRLATELMLDLDHIVTVYDFPNDALSFTLGADPDNAPYGYHQVRRHAGHWLYCCDQKAKPATCAFLIGGPRKEGEKPLTDDEAIDQAAALVLSTYRARKAHPADPTNQNDNPPGRPPHCPA